MATDLEVHKLYKLKLDIQAVLGKVEEAYSILAQTGNKAPAKDCLRHAFSKAKEVSLVLEDYSA